MDKKEYSSEEILERILDAIGENERKKKIVLVNRETVAKRLHVSKCTLWRWDRSGYLPAVRIGHAIWYRLEDVEALKRGENIIMKGGLCDE